MCRLKRIKMKLALIKIFTGCVILLINTPAFAAMVTVTVNFTGQATSTLQTSFNPALGEPAGSFTIEADISLTGLQSIDLDSPGAITAFAMTYGNQEFDLDDLSWPDGTEVHPFVHVPNNIGVSVSFIDGILDGFTFNFFNGVAYGGAGLNGLSDCLPHCVNVGGNGSIGIEEFLSNGAQNSDNFNFATLTTVEAPIPAPAWLFGSALGLLNYARRLGRS